MRQGRSILADWLYRSIIIIAVLISGLNLYSWNAKSLIGNRMPMLFGMGAAVVLSGSMEPVISVNDLVFIRNSKKYEIGEIVVYQSGRELIIHRIVAIDGDMITTKGDANVAADEPIDNSLIKGKLIADMPWIGIVVRGLKTPAVVFGLSGIAVFLMELSFWKEEK
jgi:signal peptidase